jgi:hypothetical protein
MKRRNLFIVLAVFVVIISASKLNAVEGEVPAQQDELSADNANLKILNRDISIEEYLSKMVSSGKIEYISRTGRKASVDIKNVGDLTIGTDWVVGASKFAREGDKVYVKNLGDYMITAIVKSGTQLLFVEGPALNLWGDKYIYIANRGQNRENRGFLGGEEISAVGDTYTDMYIVYAEDDRLNSIRALFDWLKFICKYGFNGYDTLNKDIVVELATKSDFFKVCNEKILNVMTFEKKLDNYAKDYLKNNYMQYIFESGVNKGISRYYHSTYFHRTGILKSLALVIDSDYYIDVKNEMLIRIENSDYSSTRDAAAVMIYVEDNSIRIEVDPKDLWSFVVNTEFYSIKVYARDAIVRIEKPLPFVKATAVQ